MPSVIRYDQTELRTPLPEFRFLSDNSPVSNVVNNYGQRHMDVE